MKKLMKHIKNHIKINKKHIKISQKLIESIKKNKKWMINGVDFREEWKK